MSVECPSCDRDFGTKGAMRCHHSKTHGESIPNRECNVCGDMFYDSTSQLKRCNECKGSKGELNSAYKSAKEEAVCEICGDSFEYYPSAKSGIYCSKCVKEEKWQDPPDLWGSDNPRWNGGVSKKKKRECSYCEKEIKVRAVRANNENVFCNPQCCGKWKSENIVGEEHHHWKGGGNTEYGKGWTRAKRKALKRDNYTCQRCFESKGDGKYVIDVHHIKPVRTFEYPEDAHFLDNLVTLCRSCHRKVEYNEDISVRKGIFDY